MQALSFDSLVREIAFETFGVRFGVGVDDPGLWPYVAGLIPPHSAPCNADAVEQHFSLTSNEGGTFTLRYDVRDGIEIGPSKALSYVASEVDLPLALGLLDDYLCSVIGMRASDRIFIHGAAVGYGGSAIVMPGEALTGKSTLVAALLRAGATYYSDRFAVIDPEGRVHPFASPLRVPGGPRVDGDGTSEEGIPMGQEPLPVGAVVFTNYRPGAEWQPVRVSAGEGALAIMGLLVPAHERQDESMRAVRRAFEADPLVIRSDRGEAEPVASALLAELQRRPAAPA